MNFSPEPLRKARQPWPPANSPDRALGTDVLRGPGSLRRRAAVLVLALAWVARAHGQDIPFRHVTVDLQGSGDCKAVADLDGDGRLDLVVGGSTLSWYAAPAWDKTVVASAEVEFSTDMDIADVDGDGDSDLIVPDGGAGVYWFENPRPAGDPAAGPWMRRFIGNGDASFDHDVEAADLDGDLDADVVARPKGGTAYVFRHEPDGSWTMRALALGTEGEGLEVADLDGDGRQDLVVEGRWLRTPQDLIAGTWTETVYAAAWAGLDAKVAVGDVNGDTRPDIVLSPSEGAFRIAWYQAPIDPAAGAWPEQILQGAAERFHSLALADMDLDGDLDVVAAEMHISEDPDEVVVFRNQSGAGDAWARQVLAESGSHNLVVADLGNDRDMDLFGANFIGQPPVSVWENLLDPRLSLDDFTYKSVTESHALSFGLGFGDLDQDGQTDIVSGGFWYHNPGGDLLGAWTQGGPFPDEVQAMLVVDVDGDAFADVLGQKTEGAVLRLYWLEALDGAGAAWSALPVGGVAAASHPQGAQGYGLGDVVAGGRPEVLLSGGDGIHAFRIPANPAAGDWPRFQISPEPSDEGFGIGDIDRDGRLDVAATTGAGRQVRWYRNPGNGSGGWAARQVGDFSEAIFPDRCALADLDGDGRLDVLVTEENGLDSGARTYWWRQPQDLAAGVWTRTLIVTQGTTNSMDVADMDGDGDTDVLLAEHRGARKLAIWESTGGGALLEHVVDTGKESHLGARAADLDRDGDLDIVSIAFDAPQLVHLWRNDSLSGGGTPPRTAAPAIQPAGGTVEETVSITLSSATPGAEIRYTLDGAEPVLASILYTGPFRLPVGPAVLLQARAFRAGFLPSDVASATFTVQADRTPPAIDEAQAPEPTSVLLRYTEPVQSASAQDEGRYTIDCGLGPIAIVSALLQSDGRSVSLTTASLPDGIDCDLEVSGVLDLASSPNAAQDSATVRHASGLIALLRLDEGAGLDASDASGNGHGGTLRNGAAWSLETPLQGGRSVRFDGQDDRLDLGNLDAEPQALTLALWLRAEAFSANDPRLISKAAGTAEQDHVWMLGTIAAGAEQRLRFRLKAGGATTTLIAAAGALAPGVWTHAAAVYDGSAMRLYKDGVEVGSLSKTGAVALEPGTGTALGDQPEGAGSRPFQGQLDEVRLYGRALDAEQVQRLAAGLPVSGTVCLSGTAEGGSVQLIVLDRQIQVDTFPGQTPAQVAAALADAVNADTSLASRGVTALAEGDCVVIHEAVPTLHVEDPGLTPPPPAPLGQRPEPALATTLVLLALVLRGRARSGMKSH